MKRKGLAGILSLLISVAVVGVGFASWVITAGETETVEGNVTVESITDNRVTLQILESDKSVLFSGKSTNPGTYSNPWLTTTSTEDLTITINYQVGFKDTTKSNYGDITVSAEGVYTEIQSAITKNYIAVDSLTVNNPASDGTGSIVLKFKWGTAFGGQNPFDYYNSKGVNEIIPDTSIKYSDDAYTKLNELSEFNSAKFTINVTASYTPTPAESA